MTRIFITTNPGFENKGDAAILLGTFKCLRMLDNAEISLLSSRPEFDREKCDVKIISNVETASKKRALVIRAFKFIGPPIQHLLLAMLYRISGRYLNNKKLIMKSNIWEEYCKSDVIIAGLDDSFTTLYESGPFLLNFYTIFLGKLLRKKVVLYGSSIGPFKSRIYEILGRYILKRADLVTLREEISYEYLKKIGVKNPAIYVTADLAFALSPSPSERVRDIMSTEGINEKNRLLVGMSLSQVIPRWAFPEIEDVQEKYEKFIKIMAQVVDNLIEKLQATIVFVPHSLGPNKGNDDRIAHRDIFQLIKNKNDVILIETEHSPEELRGLIGDFDLFLGARTHSVISSAVMCTPFVALEYESFKTRGIIGKMLGCEELVYDIKNLSYNTLLSAINDAWGNRAEIRKELESKIEDIKQRALLNAKLVKELIEH